MENGLAVCAVFAHIRIFTGSFTSKTKTHADPYRINVRLQDRSGETRTRGLLLPKQARYQLRNTPASGGTAAPPKYSISFFVRFVNTESAADGAARPAFFSRQKRQLATAKKGTAAGTFMATGCGFGATAEKRMQKLYRVQNLLHSSCKLAGKVLS